MKTQIATILLITSIAWGSFAFGGRFQPASNDGITTESTYRTSQANLGIGVEKAWQTTKGSKKVTVAVIDSGIDSEHKEFRGNLWYAHGTDTYGYDFGSNSINPLDYDGHGTHIAGIIQGIADVRIMPVSYWNKNHTSSQNAKGLIKAIHWAIDHDASIINISGGGPLFLEEEYLAIRRAEALGILVVAAAGNEGEDLDDTRFSYYPADYRLTNVISVANLESNGRLADSSNYGRHQVHLGAPGVGIASTYPHGRYAYMTGTSQATAVVSGVAALMLSANPKLKPSQVRQILMDTVDRLPALEKVIISGGRVNAEKAVREVLSRRNHQ